MAQKKSGATRKTTKRGTANSVAAKALDKTATAKPGGTAAKLRRVAAAKLKGKKEHGSRAAGKVSAARKKRAGGNMPVKAVAKARAKTAAAKTAAAKPTTAKPTTAKPSTATARTATAKTAVAKTAVAKTAAAKTTVAKSATANATTVNKTATPTIAVRAVSVKETKPAAAAPHVAPPVRMPQSQPAAAMKARSSPQQASIAEPARREGAAPIPTKQPQGVEVKGTMGPRFAEILSPAALAFVADLHRRFDAERKMRLQARQELQKKFDAGWPPDFRLDTRAIRQDEWRIAPLPADLMDRRVEITGPVDRKMIVNALNSGANVFMADFEDASSPLWTNMIEGQLNLKDRWNGAIDFTEPSTGKSYRLSAKPAVLMVRPRGWHLPEAHLRIDGEPVSASLFDFGLYAFHNVHSQIAQGATPAFYLPKLENHLEARLWNAVLTHAEKELGLAHGTMKATVLIETLPAAFEMDEILFELRDHAAGLNCGRWDYIFSFIKRLGKNPKFLTPDRAEMVMGKAFLSAYAQLLIKTCHRRGAFAMGGMAAQIPVKNNPSANAAAFAKVRSDKEREVGLGHDGTWVAHPDLVPLARQVFDEKMPGINQLDKLRNDVNVTQADLLQVHTGQRTEAGLRENIRVGVQYIEAWLRGRGAVPLYNLMEDAATAEISRAQVWQWLRHRARLADGREVTPALFQSLFADEMAKVRAAIGPAVYDAGRFAEATKLFSDMSLAADFAEFLTIPAYALLEQGGKGEV
jgi:malate synthase